MESLRLTGWPASQVRQPERFGHNREGRSMNIKQTILIIAMISSTPAVATKFSFSLYTTNPQHGGKLIASGSIRTGKGVKTVLYGTRLGHKMTILPPGTFQQNNNWIITNKTTGRLAFDQHGFGYKTDDGVYGRFFEDEEDCCFDNRSDDNRAYGDLGYLIMTNHGVPEPASWALMVGGFGLVGGAARRTRVSYRAKPPVTGT